MGDSPRYPLRIVFRRPRPERDRTEKKHIDFRLPRHHPLPPRARRQRAATYTSFPKPLCRPSASVLLPAVTLRDRESAVSQTPPGDASFSPVAIATIVTRSETTFDRPTIVRNTVLDGSKTILPPSPYDTESCRPSSLCSTTNER